MQLPNNHEYTIALASQARRLGFSSARLPLLGYLGGPGNAGNPEGWQEIPSPTSKRGPRLYAQTIQAMPRRACCPTCADRQRGINGMMGPMAVCPERDQFVDLRRRHRGSQDRPGRGAAAQDQVHIDRWRRHRKTRYYFATAHLPGEIRGHRQVLYPWWHGSLNDQRENMHYMATE